MTCTWTKVGDDLWITSCGAEVEETTRWEWFWGWDFERCPWCGGPVGFDDPEVIA